jgi:hypothetical protein
MFSSVKPWCSCTLGPHLFIDVWMLVSNCLFANEHVLFFSSVAVRSLKDRGRLTYRRRFLELFRHMVGLLGRVNQPVARHLPTQDNTTQTRTNIHALNGIRTRDPSNQPAKAHASDRTTTVTGEHVLYILRFLLLKALVRCTDRGCIRIRPCGLFQFRITSEIMNHQQMAGLLGRVISSSQDLYLHRTTQNRQTRTKIHALSGIRTRDPVYDR